MEYVELISAIWPIFLGFVVLVLSIGKLMSRMDVVVVIAWHYHLARGVLWLRTGIHVSAGQEAGSE